MTQPPTKLQAKIAEAKAAREAAEKNKPASEAKPQPAPEVAEFAHLAPEPDYEPDPFDEVLGNLSILTAYEKWCGKSRPSPRNGQTESIMVSCPTPAHRDANPSAWLNTQSNTWFCGGCQLGGDVYDIASFYFDIKDYKTGLNFGKLRRAMAEDLGYGVAKVGKKDVPYLKVVPDPEPEQAPVNPEAKLSPETKFSPATNSASITPALAQQIGSIKTNEELDAELAQVIELGIGEQTIFPTLDWKKIVTPGTFLDDYMAATTIDDIAEEYHFWNALIALGLSIGRDAYLRDSPNVYGNLFVCLLGLTGDGKSRSMRHLRAVLTEAIPYAAHDDYPRGANLVPTPSSAEALITMFTHPVMDPTTNKLIADYAPLRGLVEFGEMAELAAKAARAGNAGLKTTLIDFYDMKSEVATNSITNGIKRAREPFCSVFTTTQPDSLKRILSNADKSSGFLNRWVFASGKPKVRSFFQEDIVDVTDAIESLKRVHGWVGLGKEIRVEEMAAQLMEEFYREHLSKLVASEGSGMLSRLPLLYKKLLLLLAANEHSPTVTADMASKVISMHDYSVEAYGIPSRNIGADDLTNVYNELSASIRKLTNKDGEGPTYSQLKRILTPKGFQIALVDRAFKILENMNEIEIYSKQSARGRPAQRYRWVG